MYQFDLQNSNLSSQDFGLDFQNYTEDRIPGRPLTTEITSVCANETYGTLATTWLICAASYGIMLSPTRVEDVDGKSYQQLLFSSVAMKHESLETSSTRMVSSHYYP